MSFTGLRNDDDNVEYSILSYYDPDSQFDGIEAFLSACDKLDSNNDDTCTTTGEELDSTTNEMVENTEANLEVENVPCENIKHNSEEPMVCDESGFNDYSMADVFGSITGTQEEKIDGLIMDCKKKHEALAVKMPSKEQAISTESMDQCTANGVEKASSEDVEHHFEEPMAYNKSVGTDTGVVTSCNYTMADVLGSITDTQEERADRLIMAFEKQQKNRDEAFEMKSKEWAAISTQSVEERLNQCTTIGAEKTFSEDVEHRLELPSPMANAHNEEHKQQCDESQMCIGAIQLDEAAMSCEDGDYEVQLETVDSEVKCKNNDPLVIDSDHSSEELIEETQDISELKAYSNILTDQGNLDKLELHTVNNKNDSEDHIQDNNEVQRKKSDSNLLQNHNDVIIIEEDDSIDNNDFHVVDDEHAKDIQTDEMEQISADEILVRPNKIFMKFSKAVHNHVMMYMTTDTGIAQVISTSILSRNIIHYKTVLRPLKKVNDGCGEMPQYLIGYLTWKNDCSLEIIDSTNKLACLFQDIDFSHVCTYIVVEEFQFIHNTEHSYVEIIKYQSISKHPLTTNDSAGLCEVTGLVRAVSSPIRQQNYYYFLVEVETATDKEYIVVMSNHLLFSYHHIIVNKYYTFTDLNNTVLNNQREAKVTTTNSTIKPCNPSLDILHLTPYTASACKATITDVLVPEAGLYELNNNYRLYLYQFDYFNNGEGLHKGTEIGLSNFHMLSFRNSNWKCLSGAFGCVYSTLTFLRFAKVNSHGFKPFIPKSNRLVKFLQKYSSTNAALLMELYRHCSNTLRAGFAKRFAILEKVSSLLHMEPLSERNNTAMTFFSSPHECFFNSVTLRLSSVLSKWPTTILSIEQLIETYCNVVSDTNSSLIRVQESTSSSSVEWCYTEETINKILIGYLSTNFVSGVSIIDKSESIDIVLPSITPHVGSYIVITKMKIITEHTHFTVPTSLEPTHTSESYVFPLIWMMVPSTGSNVIPCDKKKNCTYFIVVTKNLPVMNGASGNVSFQVLVRMEEDIHMLERAIGTECVLNISDVDRYYGYLEYGCLYSLVSSSQRFSGCSELFVTDNCVIELLEESDKWCPFAARDVSELIDSSLKFARETPVGNLVTFNGIIMKRSYRLPSIGTMATSPDQFTLALEIKSVVTPDTIILYIHCDQFIVPVGLLPGTKVKFCHVILKCSRTDSTYCTFCEHSSVQIIGTNSLSTNVPIEYELPIVDINTLIQKFNINCLSRIVVCVLGWITAIQYFKLEMECSVHKTLTINCSSLCSNKHRIKIEGSAMFTDGSGECQIYFDSDTAQGIMKCEETKWSQLMEFVEKYRSVKYYRVQQAQNPGEELLCSLVKSSSVTTQVKLNCQPFNISKQQKEGIKLKKVTVQGITHVVECTQKLQLKVVSIQPIHHRLIARKQYDQLIIKFN